MSIPYVCQTCRTRSISRLCRVTTQLHSRATFISLNPSKLDPSKSRSRNEGDAKSTSAKIADITEGVSIPVASQKRTRQSYVPKSTPEDELELLFEESLKPLSTSGPGVIATARIPSTEAYDRVSGLKQRLIAKNYDLADAWEFFVENLGPTVWRGQEQHIVFPNTLPDVSRLLMQHIITARGNGNAPEGVPSLSEAAMVYTEVGIMHHRDWLKIIWVMLRTLLRHRDLQSCGQRESVDKEFIEDFVGVWRLFSAITNPTRWLKMEEASIHGFEFLPPVNVRDLIREKQTGGLDKAFGKLYQGVPETSKKDLAAAAILTFDILTGFASTELPQLHGGDKFISALSSVIVFSRITSSDLEACFRPLFGADWVESYMTNWPLVMTRCKASIPQRAQNGINDKHTFHRVGHVNITDKLEVATKKRDVRRINSLWAEAVKLPPTHYERNTEGDESQSLLNFGLTQPLCDNFIRAYTTVRMPERAVQVWNHMITVGLTPDLFTWNAMLEGCKSARDAKSLESIWGKLLKSGSVPDAACWTTRISCLIDSGLITEGVKALDDMGSFWLREATRKHKLTKDSDHSKIGDVNGIVKPTTATINAGISALVRRNRMEFAPRIIAWAGKIGISPDVTTYNIILRPLVRSGRNEDVQKLLQTMQNLGVKADVVTFTTILDETFRSDIPHTPAEQTEIVSSIFEEMKVSGVEANQHTYGTIIYNLLQSCEADGDMSAVKAVLRRMTDNRILPSTHIYTMLLEHHLKRDPPDIEAARALLESINISGSTVDHIFWDRVVEGFSRARDTNTALLVLGKQDRRGHQVGWNTLAVLIQALLENGEEDMAKRVLKDVRTSRGGPLSIDEKGKEGQHLFWYIMAEKGLVDPSEVESFDR